MTVAVPSGGGGLPGRSTGSGLADVIDTILDKGLVIDAYVRVSLVGIEVLTIDARVVVASVDTYLRFAEAVNRLDLSQTQEGLPELIGDMTQGVAQNKSKGVAKGVLEAAGEKLQDLMSGYAEEPAPRSRRRRED
ncbi:gas vesicle protein GvpJ [Microbispora sp. ATCC PTA-5024]|uniref:gas vesicle protein GvpJ n=1 Tax=Microbispora sp. ATCC PTA-5024 TaxID=316330 RepID=UPI0003DC769D|nr:gas vesicle protein GvpJ [Microbispora sp. ATCC PTA-5024]ETK35503.1 gas vesicle protein [Microbispora sp. ATCC PTA-5024]